MSTRRKLAIATWDAPREGNIYGKLTLDAGRVLDWIEEERKRTGEKITITHVVGKACALALHRAPTLNGRIFLGSYRPFKDVSVSFLVSVEGGNDLAKALVQNADVKSVSELAKELRERSDRLKAGKDDDFEKSKGLLRLLPTWVLRPLVHLVGWLASCAGLTIKALGVEAFPFGACIITSVGMFGLDEGYAPPTPWAHVPLYVLIGAVRKQPTVVDDRIEVRPLVTLTATIDHRFIDGYQGALLAQTMREVFADPSILGAAAASVPAAASAP
ncbi:MAG: 2-oxo acid dehydrogenase subunit E2 [Deltaproteobacteria bacterium]|nr:2-oxo acid dehydrogenase subunit E2 [Deltaproteobacteria bacterium]